MEWLFNASSMPISFPYQITTSVPGPSRWDGDEDPGKIHFIVPKFWEKNRRRSATQPYCNTVEYIDLYNTGHAYSDIHWSQNLEYQDGGQSASYDQHFQYINRLPYFKEIYRNLKRCLKAYSYTRKEHWTWSTNMAAMASKFNFECVIQYYTDQWLNTVVSHCACDCFPKILER